MAATPAAQSLCLRALERWLRSPIGAARGDRAGFVHICDAVGMCQELSELCGGALAPVAEAARCCPPHGPVELDAAGRAVRLRGVLERVSAAVQSHLADPEAPGGYREEEILDVLKNSEHLGGVLRGIASEVDEQLDVIRAAVDASSKLAFRGSVVFSQVLAASEGAGIPSGSGVERAESPAATPRPPTSSLEDAWSRTPSSHGQEEEQEDDDDDVDQHWREERTWVYNPAPGGAVGGGGVPLWVAMDAAEDSRTVRAPTIATSVSSDWGEGNDSRQHRGAFEGLLGSGSPSMLSSTPNSQFGSSSPSMLGSTPPAGAGNHSNQSGRPAPGNGSAWMQEAHRKQINLAVEDLLCSPPAALAGRIDSDGSVHVRDLLRVDNRLAVLADNRSSVLLKAAAAGPGRVVLGPRRQTLMLASAASALCSEVEAFLWKLPEQRREASLIALLANGPIKTVAQQLPASSSGGVGERLAEMRKALLASAALDVGGVEGDQLEQCMVRLRPVSRRLYDTANRVLLETDKARAVLHREGEVAVSWIVAQPALRRMLSQFHLVAEEALQMLCMEFERSDAHELDGKRMSVRPSQSQPQRSLPGAQHTGGKTRYQKRYSVVRDKDVKLLRELLCFYFELFNFQHNRMLMAFASSHRQWLRSASQSSDGGHRLVFSLGELSALPRLGRILNFYNGPEPLRRLLEGAVHGPHGLPVRIVRSSSNEAGAGQHPLALELTYTPNLRFVEGAGACAEIVDPIVAPIQNPRAPMRGLPARAVCVLSYSVSSDLSHGQSPRAQEMLAEAAAGRLDPRLLTWDSRQQKIVRQLHMYSADVICIQGLQSIGFRLRCSEDAPDWFSCVDEPASNHLVRIYQELCRENYAVAFAPTMKMPGSPIVVFGNAVFWKRSRWALENCRSLYTTAVCVQLVSRLGNVRLQVCSAKGAATYAQEWGDAVTEADLSRALVAVGIALSAPVVPSSSDESGAGSSSEGARMPTVWCGDFGMPPQDLLDLLAASPSAAAAPWRSSSATVLGHDPWSALSGLIAGRAVDAILCHTLAPQVVLGGLQHQVGFADFLRDGYPSDHLLQLAVFSFDTEQPSTQEESEERPQMNNFHKQDENRRGRAPAKAAPRAPRSSAQQAAQSHAYAEDWRQPGRQQLQQQQRGPQHNQRQQPHRQYNNQHKNRRQEQRQHQRSVQQQAEQQNSPPQQQREWPPLEDRRHVAQPLRSHGPHGHRQRSNQHERRRVMLSEALQFGDE